MKKLHFLSLFLLLLFSCQKKFDYEYQFICELPAYTAEKAFLVITNTDGEELEHFVLPNSGREVRQKFSLQSKYPITHYDAHIIIWEDDEDVLLYSQLDVKNAESIVLMGAELPPPPPLIIENTVVKMPYQPWSLPGLRFVDGSLEDSISCITLGRRQNQDIFIDCLPCNPSQHSFRYLSALDLLSDTIIIPSSSFSLPQKKINIHPSINPYSCKEIIAVAPDFSRFVYLAQDLHCENDSTFFALPENLDPSWNLYVRFDNAGYATAKIFTQNELIDFGEPSIAILSKASSMESGIEVSTSGDVDFMIVQKEGRYELNGETWYSGWNIQGPPGRFEHYQIPQIQKYLPHEEAQFSKLVNANSKIFFDFVVRAFHDDKLEYNDMIKGFPWKSDDLFIKSTNGYEEVTRYR